MAKMDYKHIRSNILLKLMAKGILFIHTEKVPVRSQRYPHINLSRSTSVFPAHAKDYLERLGKGKLVKADFDEEELCAADEKWLSSRLIFIPLNGELYCSKLIGEIKRLEEWAGNGVIEGELGEYTRRLNALRKEAESVKNRLFESASAEKLIASIALLSQPGQSSERYSAYRVGLKKVTSPEQEEFKNKVEEILMRPMDAEELSRELRMDTANLRKRMKLLTRSGLVKTTTQRLSLGRPRVVYYLSHDI
jgi:hypothetical protein